jgi:hypothetical protein
MYIDTLSTLGPHSFPHTCVVRDQARRGGDIFRSEKKCSNQSNSAMVHLVHVSGYSDRSHLADPGIIYLFSQK